MFASTISYHINHPLGNVETPFPVFLSKTFLVCIKCGGPFKNVVIPLHNLAEKCHSRENRWKNAWSGDLRNMWGRNTVTDMPEGKANSDWLKRLSWPSRINSCSILLELEVVFSPMPQFSLLLLVFEDHYCIETNSDIKEWGRNNYGDTWSWIFVVFCAE